MTWLSSTNCTTLHCTSWVKIKRIRPTHLSPRALHQPITKPRPSCTPPAQTRPPTHTSPTHPTSLQLPSLQIHTNTLTHTHSLHLSFTLTPTCSAPPLRAFGGKLVGGWFSGVWSELKLMFSAFTLVWKLKSLWLLRHLAPAAATPERALFDVVLLLSMLLVQSVSVSNWFLLLCSFWSLCGIFRCNGFCVGRYGVYIVTYS